ncbi:unnamed protein product, partial [Didymodactylos carnosus]
VNPNNFVVKVVDNCDLNTNSLDGKGSLHYVNTLYIQCDVHVDNTVTIDSNLVEPKQYKRSRKRRFRLSDQNNNTKSVTITLGLQTNDQNIHTNDNNSSISCNNPITVSRSTTLIYVPELFLHGLTFTNLATSLQPMPLLSGYFSKYILPQESIPRSTFVYGCPITHVASSNEAIEEILTTTKQAILDSNHQQEACIVCDESIYKS